MKVEMERIKGDRDKGIRKREERERVGTES